MACPRSALTHGVLAASLLLAGCSSDDEPEPTGYRITYDVVTSDQRSTEVLEVERGAVSRRLVGESGTAVTQDGVYTRAEGRWVRIAALGPGEVGEDLQLTAALDWAAAAGIAARAGSSTVAGLPCTQWRTAQPLEVGPWAPAGPNDETTSCVDERGRLLADRWLRGAMLVRSRTATSVTAVVVRPFDGASPHPIAPALLSLAVTRQDEPTADLVVPSAPPGGSLLAAAAMLEVEPGTLDVVERTHRAVYEAAGVLVVLDQVRATGQSPKGDRDVRLGPLGVGRVAPTAGGLVLEVTVGQGLVRVRSGLPYATTVAWLSGLRRV